MQLAFDPVAPQSFSAYHTELQRLQTWKTKSEDQLATLEELLTHVATTLETLTITLSPETLSAT